MGQPPNESVKWRSLHRKQVCNCASVLQADLHISSAIQVLQWYPSSQAHMQRQTLSSATTHKPVTQNELWEPQAGETLLQIPWWSVGTCNSLYVYVCVQKSFFLCSLENWTKWMQWIGVEICQLWSNQLCECICKWYRHLASLHPFIASPIFRCSHLRPGLKKRFFHVLQYRTKL